MGKEIFWGLECADKPRMVCQPCYCNYKTCSSMRTYCIGITVKNEARFLENQICYLVQCNGID